MMRKLIFYSLLIVILASGCFSEETYLVFMAGDSTMANKTDDAYPETGWGQVFPEYFDTTKVVFDNHARNGRSSKSFRSEGLWDNMMNKVEPESYVFIQFGHNDERPSKGPDRYSTIPEFKENLRGYIQDVRQREAFPILLTPIVRRKFDENGNLENTHLAYPDATRSVAEEMKVPLIDLTKLSAKVVEGKGDSLSKALYNWVKPGHKNFPEGKQDDTHFSPDGARIMAGLVVDALKEKDHPLTSALKNK